MKNLAFISVLIFSLSSFASDATPVGIWIVPKGDVKIQIEQVGDTLEGKIIWLKEPLDEKGQPKIDTKNPDANLQSRPILSMVLLKGFKKEKDENKWSDGTIYDAYSGNTYKAWMKPDGEKNFLYEVILVFLC